MEIDFTNIYKAYKGKWIALDSKLEKVISSGTNAERVHKEAVNKVASPVLFKVPKKNVAYIG